MPRITLTPPVVAIASLVSNTSGEDLDVLDPAFPAVLGVAVQVTVTYGLELFNTNFGIAAVQYSTNNGSSWATLGTIIRQDLGGSTVSQSTVALGNLANLADFQIRTRALATTGTDPYYVYAEISNWSLSYVAPARGVVLEA